MNLLLRAGLDHQTRGGAPAEPYRVTPVSTGAPRVDPSRPSELLALDDEADWGQRGG